ncbi:MAG TPA: undecaprenyl-diphosphate phosphatase [Jatrophihabitans sp.]|nr:undecaprenyl-diphosphate phosphatase [Jatrophihabitans sp.]
MNPAIYHMNYLQAIVIGLIQGLTELFPISSLGHTVLIPSWLGGSWATLVRQENSAESPYLAFVVGLHLATAIVLLGFYWREWIRLIRAFVVSIARRRVETTEQRLAWLIVIATIPVGALGLGLEHLFRTLFAKPLAAAIFLTVNGLILLAGERYRRTGTQHSRARVRESYAATATAAGAEAAAGSDEHGRGLLGTIPATEGDEALSRIGVVNAFWIGAAQSLALLAGISREGVAMVGGLFRGLTREDALRFAFMLSTPVILAAGALKIGDLTGPLGAGIRGQAIAGSIAAAATSLFAVIFLSRYFKTRTLYPFAIYCLLAGGISVLRFGLF